MIRLKPHIQKEGFCGPASLKMVLEHFGVKKSQAELGRMVRCSKQRGCRISNIAKAAKTLGFKAFVKDYSNIGEIKKFLKKKIPVIVNWYSEEYDHYSIVIKVSAKYIFIQDPEHAKPRKISIEKFRERWFGFDLSGRFLKSPQEITIRRILVIYK